MNKYLILFSIVLVLFISCGKNSPEKGFVLSSTAFSDGDKIPSKYTGDGENVSPPLAWKEPPAGTKSFALICDDPDAPVGTWVHWVIYNMPDNVLMLAENTPIDPVLESGAKQGKNDFNKSGYGGPAPPSGIHRYYFKLYALDIILEADHGLTKSELLSKMKGHILGETVLMGKYSRR